MTLDRRYLYDDRLTILFNYKDGNKTYTFAEIETAQKGSGLSALATLSVEIYTNPYKLRPLSNKASSGLFYLLWQ